MIVLELFNETPSITKNIFENKSSQCSTFIFLKPLLPNAPFLYPMKTSENLRFSNVFRGYKKGISGSNGLKT